jgi:5-formyltetrahydrofolate cyclo-ligase
MRDNKQTLRARALIKRESLPVSDVRAWSHLIQERVLDFSPYVLAPAVALYSPIGNEVATEEIRDHSLRVGKKVFYPKVGKGEELLLIRVRSAEELKPGRYRILEPVGTEVITEQDQQGLVVFVPGLVFDLEGERLGRGRGGYDRLLARLAEGVTFISLAYEFQIMEELPTEKWDRKVHHIITERRTIDCGDFTPRSDGVS